MISKENCLLRLNIKPLFLVDKRLNRELVFFTWDKKNGTFS